jgi:hypothetical protein
MRIQVATRSLLLTEQEQNFSNLANLRLALARERSARPSGLKGRVLAHNGCQEWLSSGIQPIPRHAASEIERQACQKDLPSLEEPYTFGNVPACHSICSIMSSKCSVTVGARHDGPERPLRSCSAVRSPAVGAGYAPRWSQGLTGKRKAHPCSLLFEIHERLPPGARSRPPTGSGGSRVRGSRFFSQARREGNGPCPFLPID